jgi:hypothetical protein
MTKPWTNDRPWQGLTAAVLACGPSMSGELAEALREHRTIAVNEAIRVAPWADATLALDANWTTEQRSFAGLRLTGIEDPELDAFYIGHRFERIRLAPSHVVEISNSGLAAIRLAAEMGAARILLAGFEPESPGHFYDDEVHEYVGIAIGIRQLTEELAQRGVTVERYELPPAADVKPAGPTASRRKRLFTTN